MNYNRLVIKFIWSHDFVFLYNPVEVVCYFNNFGTGCERQCCRNWMQKAGRSVYGGPSGSYGGSFCSFSRTNQRLEKGRDWVRLPEPHHQATIRQEGSSIYWCCNCSMRNIVPLFESFLSSHVQNMGNSIAHSVARLNPLNGREQYFCTYFSPNIMSLVELDRL